MRDRKPTLRVTAVVGGTECLHSKDSLMDLLHLLAKDVEALILERRPRRRLVSGQSLHWQAACLTFEQMRRLTLRGKTEEVFVWK